MFNVNKKQPEKPSQPETEKPFRERMPELTGQQESQPENPSSPVSSQTIEVDYFDSLITEEQAAAQEVQAQIVASDLYSADEFRQSFFGLHAMASAMTGVKALALPNSRVTEEMGGNVSDALYETILEIPMMHFMLKRDGKWLGRAFVMFVYVQGMRGAIIEEVGARPKKADKKPPPQQPLTRTPDQMTESELRQGMSQQELNNLFNGGQIG